MKDSAEFYKTLLEKYMSHVDFQEGTMFLGECLDEKIFDDEETSELNRIAVKIIGIRTGSGLI